MLCVFGLIAFIGVARSSRFEQFHNVDIFGLLVAGMCFGVALALLLRVRRKEE
jgi:hypothetical protein